LAAVGILVELVAPAAMAEVEPVVELVELPPNQASQIPAALIMDFLAQVAAI
jgi:hypothetical protein